jgi:hypothetical protein
MIQVYNNTKIFFVAPAAYATGGPEAIHRLAAILKYECNYDVRMVYLPDGHPDPIHRNYKSLELPVSEEIEDDSENIVVLPEYFPHLRIAENLKRIQVVIWWLSVDFFYSTYFHAKAGAAQRRMVNWQMRWQNTLSRVSAGLVPHTDIFSRTMLKLERLKLKDIDVIRQAKLHLCQSAYALNHLAKQELLAARMMLDSSDRNIILSSYHSRGRDNIVAYNPAKGITFTNQVMKSCPSVKFVPIQNMTREQVTSLLGRAKVYIDFGNHPGRDRLPREAALLGCCILTSRRGSAAYQEDLPIPEKYKFIDRSSEIPKIRESLVYLLMNYETAQNEFDSYRSFIREEETKVVEMARGAFPRAG